MNIQSIDTFVEEKIAFLKEYKMSQSDLDAHNQRNKVAWNISTRHAKSLKRLLELRLHLAEEEARHASLSEELNAACEELDALDPNPSAVIRRKRAAREAEAKEAAASLKRARDEDAEAPEDPEDPQPPAQAPAEITPGEPGALEQAPEPRPKKTRISRFALKRMRLINNRRLRAERMSVLAL